MEGQASTSDECTAAAAAWAEGIGGCCSDRSAASDTAWRPSRSASWAVWREELASFEVLQPRGDSLRDMGSVWKGRHFLHTEEGVWLAERGTLALHPAPSISGEGDYPFMPQRCRTPAEERARQCAGCQTESSAEVRERAPVRMPGHPAAVSLTSHGALASRQCLDPSPVVSGPSSVSAKGEPRPGGDSNVDTRSLSRGACRSVSVGAVCLARQGSGDASCPLLGSRVGAHHKDPSGPAKARSPRPDGTSDGRMMQQERISDAAILNSRRGGRKRSQSAGHEGTPSVPSKGTLQRILARAGVSWECYLAYAELKRSIPRDPHRSEFIGDDWQGGNVIVKCTESYIVRRSAESTVGHKVGSPTAAKLSWFQGQPVTTVDDGARGEKERSLPVTFHAFKPRKVFRKRDPGPPDYIVAVCRYSDAMPAHAALVALEEHHTRLANKIGKRCLLEADKGRSDVGIAESGSSPDARNELATSTSGSYRDIRLPGVPLAAEATSRTDDDRSRMCYGPSLPAAAGVGQGRQRVIPESPSLGARDKRPGVKLALVGSDGSVHLFDVGVHVDEEA